ncbi:MAG: 23S rRNA methyltransferase [Planctomycetaceae bacterium]|nr:23S rRNA methyltransferase [Planctomycetaceae bacterium]
MRDVQDHWFRQAKREGYRSRAAFKLTDIDDRKRILSKGDRVLDCGAAPGSWSQVAGRRVGRRGSVVAVDLKPIDPSGLPENVTLHEADLREMDLETLGGGIFDVVLSDMAPDTTGDPFGDHHRSIRLCNDLLDRVPEWLRPGGNLVMKVFEGEAYRDLLLRAGRMFERAKGFKPVASRGESVEMFVVCNGLRPAEDRDEEDPGGSEEMIPVPPRPKPPPGWND